MSLRVGLVGAGMVSRHHLLAWERCPDAQVVAIADPDRAAADERCRAFAIARRHASLSEMLDRGGVDAVDIAAPLAAHRPLVEEASRRGLPILCQKPLGSTFEEAEAAAAVARDRGVRLMVHENWRFRPHYRTVRRWLDEGRIGAPRAFQLTTLGGGLVSGGGRDPPALRRQPFLATMERLLVLELLVHHFDTLRFLLGPLRVVAADVARLSPAVRGEDTASMALRGPRLSGTVFASMAAAGAPDRAEDALVVLGERGAIVLAGSELRLDGPTPKVVTVDREADYQASYDGLVAHFADALRRGAPFETSPEAHLAALAMVDAAYALSAPAADMHAAVPAGSDRV